MMGRLFETRDGEIKKAIHIESNKIKGIYILERKKYSECEINEIKQYLFKLRLVTKL